MQQKSFSGFIISVAILLVLYGCYGNDSHPKDIAPAPSPQLIIEGNVQKLKDMAHTGDLITRLKDDMLSEIIKELAENDKSYSHAGIIMEKDGMKMVCHIYPNFRGADTVLYEPLDSFINPSKNLACGLFRYDFSSTELDQFIHQLNSYHDNQVHFDNRYDIHSDTALYCSEMIAKSLDQSTNGRIRCTPILIPKKMIPLMQLYFKKLNLTYDQIEHTEFYAIEDLYQIKDCKELMRTKLKYMP